MINGTPNGVFRELRLQKGSSATWTNARLPVSPRSPTGLSTHWRRTDGAVQLAFMRADVARSSCCASKGQTDRRRHNPRGEPKRIFCRAWRAGFWTHGRRCGSASSKNAPAMPRLLCRLLAEGKAYKCFCQSQEESQPFRDQAKAKAAATSCYQSPLA